MNLNMKLIDVLPLVNQLAALVKKHIGFVTQVVADYGNEDERFEGDFGQEEFYEYIRHNKEKLEYVALYITSICRDEQGSLIEIPEGLKLRLHIFDDEYLLNVIVNTDIYAPFYYQKGERSERLAEANFPYLKNFIEDIENTIHGRCTGVDIAPSMGDYFDRIGFKINAV